MCVEVYDWEKYGVNQGCYMLDALKNSILIPSRRLL